MLKLSSSFFGGLVRFIDKNVLGCVDDKVIVIMMRNNIAVEIVTYGNFVNYCYSSIKRFITSRYYLLNMAYMLSIY